MITRGKIQQADFVTIYGQDGVGKTSLAAGAPEILFLDAENGTLHLDVSREEIKSFLDLDNALDSLIAGKDEYKDFKSVAFDSLDWLVQKINDHLCATVKHDNGSTVKSIEDYGYGKGYVYAREIWERVISKCKQIRSKGINVILLAHAQVFTVDSPDTTNAYKQFDLKLPKTTKSDISALFREACDAVLFMSYKRLTPKDDPRALDGGRVLRTQHAPGWAAKNRFGLPAEIEIPEFERDAKGAIIPGQEGKLWSVYSDAVKRCQQSGPNFDAVLALAEQVPDTGTRAKAVAAVRASKDDPAALNKHLEKLKAIVSKGKDVPVPMPVPAPKTPTTEEI